MTCKVARPGRQGLTVSALDLGCMGMSEFDPEDEVLPLCRELGIGFVAYSPLGRGFLTGRFRTFEDLPEDDYRRNSHGFRVRNVQRNLDLVERVEEIAGRKSVPLLSPLSPGFWRKVTMSSRSLVPSNAAFSSKT